jgi:hypothetical protein
MTNYKAMDLNNFEKLVKAEGDKYGIITKQSNRLKNYL